MCFWDPAGPPKKKVLGVRGGFGAGGAFFVGMGGLARLNMRMFRVVLICHKPLRCQITRPGHCSKMRALGLLHPPRDKYDFPSSLPFKVFMVYIVLLSGVLILYHFLIKFNSDAGRPSGVFGFVGKPCSPAGPCKSSFCGFGEGLGVWGWPALGLTLK